MSNKKRVDKMKNEIPTEIICFGCKKNFVGFLMSYVFTNGVKRAYCDDCNPQIKPKVLE